jgi:hypothetical protein
MRVIEAFDVPVRTVAVSPDGRFLGALAGGMLRVHDWLTGERVWERDGLPTFGQLAFSPHGIIAFFEHGWLSASALSSPGKLHRIARAPFSGAIAVSSDGKTLVATRAGQREQAKLEQWEVPGWRLKVGIDFWSPFERLAFSPNGEHVAGINRESFELRFAQSGGLNRRELWWEGQYIPSAFRRGVQRQVPPRGAFLTFPRHSETVVFGWDAEFRVMETRAGSVLKRVPSPGQPFTDGKSFANTTGLPEV